MNYTIDELIKRYPKLKCCKKDIVKTCDILVDCFKTGHKLLVCGNGGSCSDANHIAAELMKSFCKARPISNRLKNKLIRIDNKLGIKLSNSLQNGFPCIALDNHQSFNTAFINDVKDGSLYTYAQQVNVYGKNGDVLLCISTSGNSRNVCNAAITAKAKNIKVIAMSGAKKSTLSSISDITIKVNETETFKIQELHLPIYHYICLYLEGRYKILQNINE